MADTETPRCLVRDDQGNDMCDRPVEFIVWGHLYEKREKGPRCERHLPESTTGRSRHRCSGTLAT